METKDQTTLKDMSDLNLKTLEDALNAAIQAQVGGHLDVRLARFDTEGTGGSRIELVFRVFDDSDRQRPRNDGRESFSHGQL